MCNLAIVAVIYYVHALLTLCWDNAHGAQSMTGVVIPAAAALVHTVLTGYHELPFTAHQGVSRTVRFLSRKYWWETLRDDVSTCIKRCDACAKRKKTGRLVSARMFSKSLILRTQPPHFSSFIYRLKKLNKWYAVAISLPRFN